MFSEDAILIKEGKIYSSGKARELLNSSKITDVYKIDIRKFMLEALERWKQVDNMKKKFVVSYSCGKDSTLSLYRMIKAGHTPVALLVTVDKKVLRSWFHGIPDKLLKDVSKSLDIPLVLVASNGKENYGETFVDALKKIKEEMGAEACVFGDIDLMAHRNWCEDKCEKAGLEAIFPLWEEDREALTYEFIDSGFKTVIKNVKLKKELFKEFLKLICLLALY